MPRRKPSPGKAIFQTPFSDEFQRYLMYELENAKQWNPGIIEGGMKGVQRWEYKCGSLWRIWFGGATVIVESKRSHFSIRQGLTVNMGSQQIEISGRIP